MTNEEVEPETMIDIIKRRMTTPRDEWIEVNENDDMFAKAKARLQTRKS